MKYGTDGVFFYVIRDESDLGLHL